MVTRYSVTYEHEHVDTDSDGAYVKFDDYAELEAKLEEARKDSELLNFFHLSEEWNMKHVSKLSNGDIVVSNAQHEYDGRDISFNDIGPSWKGRTLRDALYNAMKGGE